MLRTLAGAKRPRHSEFLRDPGSGEQIPPRVREDTTPPVDRTAYDTRSCAGLKYHVVTAQPGKACSVSDTLLGLAPEVHLVDQHGRAVSLRHWRGQPLLLVFLRWLG